MNGSANTARTGLSRRQWLAALGAVMGTAVGVDAFVVEPTRLDVTRHQLGRATPGGTTIRIVQISDLHLRAIGAREERVGRATAELAPDLVVITGDSIDRARNLALLPAFLGLLDVHVPKLAILGNWEHWTGIDLARLAQMYAARNCQLLRNESVTITLRGRPLLVTGLDDLVGGRPDLARALDGVSWQPNHLLLAHCPVQRDLLHAALGDPRGDAPDQVDPRLLSPPLMLSGHTHGGQIAPFGVSLFTPRGSGDYVRGWFRGDGKPAMYVSQGIGMSGIQARLGVPPELAVFDWMIA